MFLLDSMCKVLENRSQQDEERMDQLTNQLKEARLLAEDADGKSDEVSRKLAFVEDELEAAEDRVKSGEAKIMELEEELKVIWGGLDSESFFDDNNFIQVVGNSLKSLEVSEEKANQRVEEFKRQLKSLTAKLKEAENRAELAEKTVKKLQKEVDRLEGTFFWTRSKCRLFFFGIYFFLNIKILSERKSGLKNYFKSRLHRLWSEIWIRSHRNLLLQI